MRHFGLPGRSPPPPPMITMVSTGTTFAPRVDLYDGSGGTVEWRCVQTDETSALLTPTFSFGASAARTYTLEVTPWSALRSINFGYTGTDGGYTFYDPGDWGHPVTPITSITGLRYATHLEFFTALTSGLLSLDFSGLNYLQCIDCYESQSLEIVTTGSLPAMRRIGLEHCKLLNMDISGMPLLEDLRFATQRTTGNLTTFELGSNALDHVWHFCANGNDIRGLDDILNGTKHMAALRQWYMWSDRFTGTMALNAGAMQEFSAHHNTISTIDLTNVTWNTGSGYTLDCSYNPGLSSVTIGTLDNRADHVSLWNFANCSASAAVVDSILIQIAALGASGTGKTITLTGNAVPTATSADARSTLTSAGYTLNLAT